MSSSDWEEVKRLAADFQRAQLSKSVQRLSERNCVELINKLQELDLLKLHYTTNGKYYVTPEQLHTEVLDELFIAGGRINLVELSSILCLDLSIIEEEVGRLLRTRPQLKLLLSQLISPDYEEALAEDINERLLKNGTVVVDDLAAECELPGDYIRKVIESRLGASIVAVQDSSQPGVFYTEQFLTRLRAGIRGLMTAVTVPTSLHRLAHLHGASEKLFMGSVERLLAAGRVCGEVTGSKQTRACTFVPALHSRTQHTWADNFLRQNGYLEFSFLRSLGLEDPAGYVRTRYRSQQPPLLLLGDVCVGAALLQQLSTAVEDAIATHAFVDAAMILPSCFSAEVMAQLVEHTLQQRGGQGGKGRRAATGSGVVVLEGQYVLSEVLVAGIKEKLVTEMTSRGNKLVAAGGYTPKSAGAKAQDSGEAHPSRKEDRRRKAAGGKTGGGTQGRETKTRSTKTKKGGRGGRGGHDSDEEDAATSHSSAPSDGAMRFPEVEFLPLDELTAELARLTELADADEEMVSALTTELHGWCRKTYAAICEESYHSLCATGGGRKGFQQLQERLLALLTTCRLAERGVKEFPDDVEAQLSRHLLRTQGAELLGELLLHLTEGTPREQTAAELTAETRQSLLQRVRPTSEGGCREGLTAVQRAVAGTDLTVFFETVEAAMHEAGVTVPKKKDNKREKQVLSCHRAGLLQQLTSCHEPALCLHLAALALFQQVTGHLLHASGKFVPHVLTRLRPHLPADLHDLLAEYQGLVMQQLTKAVDSSTVTARLEQLTPLLHDRVPAYRNTGGDEAREGSVGDA